MNAYEIADELDGRLDHKAANMLRQQADRIAELEKQLYFKDYYEKLPDTPVGLQTAPQTKCFDCGEVNPAEIHTCSPQTKPLSDEEIEDLIDNWDFGLDISPKHHMFLLCKTILKKASEK